MGQGNVGILAIDDVTGYAVACVSERSQEANRELAESRLRALAMLRDTPDEVADRLTSLSSRLIAASKACDALEDLNEIATRRITELEQRHQEHLKLIVKLTNETPFVDEIEGWKSQRASMIAEIGTLKARIAELDHQ